MSRPRLIILLLTALLLSGPAVLWAQSSAEADNYREIGAKAINLLSYVASDYPDAVRDGVVRDPGLYRQLQRNVATAGELLQQLPERPGRAQLADRLQELAAAIRDKRHADQVRRSANTAADRLAALYQVPRAPTEKLPSGETAVALYQDRCSQCHGVQGAAPRSERRLDDPARMAGFSLYDFYNALEPSRDDAHDRDVDGDLSSRERWALAVLVAGFSAPAVAPNTALAEKYPALVGLPGVAIVRPGMLPEEAREALLWWRAHPQHTAHLQHPLARAAGLLFTAQTAYRGGDDAGAYHQLILALREGFVPARAALQQRNPALAAQLQQQWDELRQAILDQAPSNEVIEKFQRLQTNVVRAREQLQPTAGRAIYVWAGLLFAVALGLGVLLWYRLRKRHVAGRSDR
ncbi:hypothetical protein PVT68_10965 [Microbulbifer bruguierae]|uniref:Cytochrome c domain-containing protein n=1 Tax=Microbulbifer bruguierae TaxID=3029061 RepID=A0ABY8N9Y4_9GAMM|nr:hypothetical protein [Microbulbifer bruguierae]WGL15290.1 hypothetical protein PVT68_10965 [Microbulbifer bruguierae]